MIARNLISDLVPPLNLTDTCEKALIWMTEFQVTHLPVVDHGAYLGLVSEDDLYDLNQPEMTLESFKLSPTKPRVLQLDHIYEVMKVASTNKLTLVPVVDEKDHYLGVITIEKLMHHFAHLSAMDEPGAILVIEMNINDYSLSEIARIMESDNIKILSSYVSVHSDSSVMDLTLKVNKNDLQTAIATLENFKYNIKGYFQETGHTEDLLDRYDHLMKYLNL